MLQDNSYERTAEWVKSQAIQHTYYSPSTPPSLSRSFDATTKTSSTYRTTTSSEATSLKPSLPYPVPLPVTHRVPPSARAPPSTHTHAPSMSTHPPRHEAHIRHSSLPFPQSPPGSGYPIAMDVERPRRPLALEEDKLQRPSLRKERRPSLIEQIKHFRAPGQRRQGSESGRKA